MTAEVIDQTPVDSLTGAESLETFLLAILERYDGLCLDNESERLQLAAALAAAFMDAIHDGTVKASVIAGELEMPGDPPRLH